MLVALHRIDNERQLRRAQLYAAFTHGRNESKVEILAKTVLSGGVCMSKCPYLVDRSSLASHSLSDRNKVATLRSGFSLNDEYG